MVSIKGRATPRKTLSRHGRMAGLLFLLSAYGIVAAQPRGAKVTIRAVDRPLKEVLADIEDQTGYTFAYSNQNIDLTRLVTFSVTRGELRRTLPRLLDGVPFLVFGSHIIVKPARLPDPEPEPIPTPLPEPPPDPEPVFEYLPSVAIAAEVTPPTPRDPPTDSYRPVKILPNIHIARDPEPVFALKTNVLSLLTTTLNLAGEIRLSDRYTLELAVFANPWLFENNYKTRHFRIRPELRYWFDRPFRGHLVGLHLQYARYNVGNIKIAPAPLKDNRFEGSLLGLGVAYGYHWPLSKRIAIEPSVGVGVNRVSHDRYGSGCCGDWLGKENKFWFGVTRLDVSFVYKLKYGDR